ISSDDMVNWTDHGEVFKVKRDMPWANQCYAPGAAVRNNKVYLYIPDGGNSIGVAVADKPEGPFTDPLKKALITKNAALNTNVPWLFDPAAFVDDDGQAYLYFGGGDGESAGTNLRAIKLNSDMISVSGTAVTINSPCSFEAAYVHKRNNTYYFSYSTNFASCSPKGGSAFIDYLTSSDPMNNFTYRGTLLANPTLNGQNINNYGNNHQGIVEYKGRWYAFYHDRRVKIANNISSGEYRSVSVDTLGYNTDGTIKQVAVTADGAPQIKSFNPYNAIKATTMNRQSGIKTDSVSAEGMILTSVSDGDWIRLKGVDFGTGAARFTVRAASASSSGGRIELRTGSQTGTLVGTCEIASTGGWTAWRNFEADVSNLSGLKDYLYLVFRGTGEPFRLSSYQFHQGSIEPDEKGYLFHDTFEGDVFGWEPRASNTVSTSGRVPYKDDEALGVYDRTAGWQGAVKPISASTFVPGQSYSFSVCAYYDEETAEATETFLFKLIYTTAQAEGDQYATIAQATAQKGSYVQLANQNFAIPAGASNLRLHVETSEGTSFIFYIDEAIGAVAGTKIDGPSGNTGVRGNRNAASGYPLLAFVKGKTLTVNGSSDTKVRIRVMNLNGRTAAKFNTNGGASVSLRELPAGKYIVEATRVKDGVRVTSSVMLR
ncbi:MAG: family 43 glycosylhydrolase, partial [Chitinispirillia bacterium]|nr:family 43 glycosylhydrolase [Chitinispirillia bacterium]